MKTTSKKRNIYNRKKFPGYTLKVHLFSEFKKVFLDLKFHDIPNTMSAACFQVSKLGVDIISIHASAGLKALKDSKKASLEGATSVGVKPPFVVGITVLTSFSLKDFQTDLDRNNSIEENVLRLAKLSFDAGLDG